MTDKTVFEFKDYKSYLTHAEAQRPGRGRGFRAELARATGCQTAYVSQVLNSKAHFSLDQAHAINKLLLHNKDEARFFLILVEFSRASTQELRSHFLEMMQELIQKQLNLKSRFSIGEILSLEQQTLYYSEWLYAAVHIATTIPKLQNPNAMADFFDVDKTKIRSILKFLVSAGLAIQKSEEQFTIGNARLHLGADSPLISNHHINWRLKGMQAFEREKETGLHYTSVVSLSNDDVLHLKSRLVKEIDAFNKTVKDSKEETLYCLTLDFFGV